VAPGARSRQTECEKKVSEPHSSLATEGRSRGDRDGMFFYIKNLIREMQWVEMYMDVTDVNCRCQSAAITTCVLVEQSAGRQTFNGSIRKACQSTLMDPVSNSSYRY